MRRPLLWACVGIIVVVFLLQVIFHPPENQPEWLQVLSEQKVELAGEVLFKEKQIVNQHILWRVTLTCPSIESFLEESANLNTQVNITKINQKMKNKKMIWETDQEEQLPDIGDRIVLQGTFRLFSVAKNPGQFDNFSYYFSKGIIGKMGKSQVISCYENAFFREKIFSMREFLSGRLQSLYPKEEASILMKMLLGDSSLMEKETKELYKDGGIMHILAISGLHISLIGMGIYQLLRKMGLPVLACAFLGITFLLVYGAMTGWSLSACRAIGMYIVRLLGEVQRKNYDMLTAMGVLAVILVLSNPGNLLQSGFWLSFGAVMGMGTISQTLQMKFPRNRHKNFNLKNMLYKGVEALCTGLNLALFTIPIQLYFFYEYPVWSILINLLVLPLLSILVLSTILSICFPIAPIFVEVSCVILNWYKVLCQLSQKLPANTWTTGFPGGMRMVIYYGAMGAVLLMFRQSKWKNLLRVKVMLMAAITLFLVILFSPVSPQYFTLQMIDVGQGDGILVRTGKGQNYLFDGGSSTYRTLGESILFPYFKYYGITRLDGIFLSHADKDHISGVLNLIEQTNEIRIECIYLPDMVDMEDFSQLIQSAGKKNIPIRHISMGDSWQWDKLSLECLYPERGSLKKDNEASACFLWRIGKYTALLTGDLEGEGEEVLADELQTLGGVDILKVAHHGSAYSTSEEFLKILHPKIALISAGENNSYGHPHEALLERLSQSGSEILCTKESGEICIDIKGDKMKVHCYR